MTEILSGWHYDRILSQRQSEAREGIKISVDRKNSIKRALKDARNLLRHHEKNLDDKEKSELESIVEDTMQIRKSVEKYVHPSLKKRDEMERAHPFLLGPATLDSLLKYKPERLDYIKEGKFPFDNVFFEFMEPVETSLPMFDRKINLCGIHLVKNKIRGDVSREGIYQVTGFYDAPEGYSSFEFQAINDSQVFIGGIIRNAGGQVVDIAKFSRWGVFKSVLKHSFRKYLKGWIWNFSGEDANKSIFELLKPPTYPSSEEFAKNDFTDMLAGRSTLSLQEMSRYNKNGKIRGFKYKEPNGPHTVLDYLDMDTARKNWRDYLTKSEQKEIEDSYKELNNLTINIINYINAQNVTIESRTRKIKTGNGGRGKQEREIIHEPEKPYHVVKVDSKKIYLDEEKEKEGELQWRVYVRGHARRYRDEKDKIKYIIWINPHVRGPENASWRHHRYAILAGMLEKEKTMLTKYNYDHQINFTRID